MEKICIDGYMVRCKKTTDMDILSTTIMQIRRNYQYYGSLIRFERIKQKLKDGSTLHKSESIRVDNDTELKNYLNSVSKEDGCVIQIGFLFPNDRLNNSSIHFKNNFSFVKTHTWNHYNPVPLLNKIYKRNSISIDVLKNNIDLMYSKFSPDFACIDIAPYENEPVWDDYEPEVGEDRNKFKEPLEIRKICWANWFGPAYVKKYGEEFLLNAPGYQKILLPDGGIYYQINKNWIIDETDESSSKREIENYFTSHPFIKKIKYIPVHLDGARKKKINGIIGHISPLELKERANRFINWYYLQRGIKLDYSKESVKILDASIGKEIKPNDKELPFIAFDMGAYIGEVFIRNYEGYWVENEDPYEYEIMRSYTYGEFYPIHLCWIYLQNEKYEGDRFSIIMNQFDEAYQHKDFLEKKMKEEVW